METSAPTHAFLELFLQVHNILWKSPAAFPHYHSRKKNQRLDELILSQCLSFFLGKVLAEPEMALGTFASVVVYSMDWATGTRFQ